jgi:hypothetical protein
MAFRFKIIISIAWSLALFLMPGCVSYQMIKSVDGAPVEPATDELVIGTTTLGEVLARFGGPDAVVELKRKNLLLYQRILYRERNITIGIPVMGEMGGPSADLSARGGLARYDTLALFFSPHDILSDVVFERGSHRPFLKTLLYE